MDVEEVVRLDAVVPLRRCTLTKRLHRVVSSLTSCPSEKVPLTI